MPAFAVCNILIHELLQRLAAMPGRRCLVDKLEVLLRIDPAEIRLDAGSLGVEINLLATNPFEVRETAMKVQSRLHDVIHVGDQGGAIVGRVQRLCKSDILDIERMPSVTLRSRVLEVSMGRKDTTAGVELATDGNRWHALRIEALKDDRLLGKLVEIGCLHPLTAVSREIVGPKSVGNQDNQVEIVARLLSWSLPF